MEENNYSEKRKNSKRKKKKDIVMKKIWLFSFDESKIKPFIIYSLIILCVTTLLYMKSLNFELTNSDDNIMFVNAQKVGCSFSTVTGSFNKITGTNYYRPLLDISLLFDAGSTVDKPNVYHRTNLILHILATLLIFWTLVKLRFSLEQSFVMGLIFAVHPVLTPAVSWISGRADSLYSIFLLMSFVFFINFRRKIDKEKWIYYGLHILFFGFGLLSKETAIVFPILLALYVILIRKAEIISKDNIYLISGWIIVIIIWVALLFKAQHQFNPEKFGIGTFFLSLPALPALLSKVFIPIKLTPYSYFDITQIIIGIAIIALAVWGYYKINGINTRKYIFGWLWFFIFLLPPLFFKIPAPFNLCDYIEYRVYLSLFGIFYVALEIINAKKVRFNEKGTISVIIGILLVFIIMNYNYQADYRDKLNFWGQCVESYPKKPAAYYDLGRIMTEKGKLDSAETLFNQGLKISPNYYYFYNGLAEASAVRDHWESSAKFASKTLSYDSLNAMANYFLAKYHKLYQHLEAAAVFFKRAEVGMKNSGLYLDMGHNYFLLGEHEKANKAFKEAIAMNPNELHAYSFLGICYMMDDSLAQSEKYFLQGLKVNPGIAECYIGLIRLYAKKNDMQRANFWADKYIQRGGTLNDELKNLLGRN